MKTSLTTFDGGHSYLVTMATYSVKMTTKVSFCPYDFGVTGKMPFKMHKIKYF